MPWNRNIRITSSLICVSAICKPNRCPVFLMLIITFCASAFASGGYWNTRNRLGNLLRRLTWFRKDANSFLYLSKCTYLDDLFPSPHNLEPFQNQVSHSHIIRPQTAAGSWSAQELSADIERRTKFNFHAALWVGRLYFFLSFVASELVCVSFLP